MRWTRLVVSTATIFALSCGTSKYEVLPEEGLPDEVAAERTDETSLEEATNSQTEDPFSADADTGAKAASLNKKTADLQTILIEARARSTNVLRAEGKRTEAVGHREQSGGEFLPELHGGFRVRHLEGAEVGSLGPFAENLSFTEYEPSASVEWRFSPFEQIAAFRASRKEEKAATYEVADERRRAMEAAAKLYYRILLSRASHRVASSLVEDAREFLTLARARTSGGVESGSDVARAEAELAEAKQKRQRTLKHWRVVSAELAARLGWEQVDRLVTPDNDQTLTTRTIVEESQTDRLISLAEKSRSDLKSAEKQVEAAEKRRVAAQWGVFGLQVGTSVGGRFIGVDLVDIGPSFIGRGFVGARIDFAQFGAVTAAKGREEVQNAERLKVEREIRREITTAKARLVSARNSLEEARNQLDAAERNHDIQKSRFEAGDAFGIEVIRAQNQLAEARLDLARRIASYNLAQVELLAATGRLSPDPFGDD